MVPKAYAFRIQDRPSGFLTVTLTSNEPDARWLHVFVSRGPDGPYRYGGGHSSEVSVPLDDIEKVVVVPVSMRTQDLGLTASFRPRKRGAYSRRVEHPRGQRVDLSKHFSGTRVSAEISGSVITFTVLPEGFPAYVVTETWTFPESVLSAVPFEVRVEKTLKGPEDLGPRGWYGGPGFARMEGAVLVRDRSEWAGLSSGVREERFGYTLRIPESGRDQVSLLIGLAGDEADAFLKITYSR